MKTRTAASVWLMYRHDFEETFHVLDGEIEVTVRGEASIVRIGDTANIPANAPHAFRNATDDTVRLLCTVAPAGLGVLRRGRRRGCQLLASCAST